MKHARNERRRGLYRSRRGIILGVCRGLAEYLDASVFWVRMGVVALLFLTGLWPTVAVYVVAALIMKKEPVVAFASESEWEFYDSYANSRTRALHRLRRIYERLDRRIQRVESRVTAKDFDWDRRMRES